MSKEIYTDLEKAFAEDFPNTWGFKEKDIKELEEIEHKRELNLVFGNKTNYVHMVPNSHFFTDLSQILESCKHTIHCKELIPILENSIKQGYKIIKE
jgi:hypothetical protein